MRERYGDLVDRLAPYFFRGDRLADAVVDSFAQLPPGRGAKMLDQALREGIDTVQNPPQSLLDFMYQLDHRPLWVDPDMVDLGGATFMRAGFLGSMALLCYSLPYGYLAPAGNKPLVFSGKLVQRAYRRLMETSRFVLEVCKPGGMERNSPGFMITARVRLMHAQVRRLLLRSGRWKSEEWGTPINQVDFLGTNLLFSIVVLQALRRSGMTFTDRESEAVMHFWKYNGYLGGIEPEILASTEVEGWRLLNLIMESRYVADDDSITLVQALMGAGEEAAHNVIGMENTRWVSRALYGISFDFIGKDNAAELQYPRTWWRFFLPVLKIIVAFTEVLRKTVPGGRRFAQNAGMRMWQYAIDKGLAGRPAQFGLPQNLGPKDKKAKDEAPPAGARK